MDLEILTDPERDSIPAGPPEGFLTEFQKWASMKTDAPEYTLQAAGLVALSLACGDNLVLRGIFSDDPIYMNIYALIVGPSTTMRKTTVLNYIRGILPRNQMTDQEYIVFLDDVSTQALNRALSDGGKHQAPTVLNVDEVAGLFETIRKQNSYLSGFEKVVLQAYDHTPIHIARTNGKIDVPEGAFLSVFAASTPEPLMQVLSSDDVETGLLPRFIVFDARDAHRGARRSLLDRLQDDDAWRAKKVELQAFLYDVAKNRADGVPDGMTTFGHPSFPRTTIGYDRDALVRLDAIDAQFHDEVALDTTAWGAIKGRAFWHIVKLAGLYAVSRDGRDATVQLPDVLRAALLVETTVSDLARMQQEVGANDLERLVAEVGTNLSITPRLSRTGFARKKKLTARELKELQDTLLVRGLIAIEEVNGTVYWKEKK